MKIVGYLMIALAAFFILPALAAAAAKVLLWGVVALVGLGLARVRPIVRELDGSRRETKSIRQA